MKKVLSVFGLILLSVALMASGAFVTYTIMKGNNDKGVYVVDYNLDKDYAKQMLDFAKDNLSANRNDCLINLSVSAEYDKKGTMAEGKESGLKVFRQEDEIVLYVYGGPNDDAYEMITTDSYYAGITQDEVSFKSDFQREILGSVVSEIDGFLSYQTSGTEISSVDQIVNAKLMSNGNIVIIANQRAAAYQYSSYWIVKTYYREFEITADGEFVSVKLIEGEESYESEENANAGVGRQNLSSSEKSLKFEYNSEISGRAIDCYNLAKEA